MKIEIYSDEEEDKLKVYHDVINIEFDSGFVYIFGIDYNKLDVIELSKNIFITINDN